jgi:transcriptional regulator with GAF, ATPase, and Fis domain
MSDGELERLRRQVRNLEDLDELLRTLTGVLDIRQVFGRVSEIAAKVLPHDALVIRQMIEGDITRARNFALSGLDGLPLPEESAVAEPALLTEPWDHFLVDDLTTRPSDSYTPLARIGLRSLLSLPVRLEGRLAASVTFLSKTIGRFTRDDVLVGRRIADQVALAMSHQRLADEHRRAEGLRASAAQLELLDELLAVVTGTGALPDVFGRVSAIARKVLPHDALVLTAVLPDGVRARAYAAAYADASSAASAPGKLPEIVAVPPRMLAQPDWDHDLVADLQAQPDQARLDAGRAGYRAALRLAIRLDGHYVAGLSFLSRTPGLYRDEDVPAARRIADRMALSFARERGDALLKRADEATARAAELERRVQALTEELDARSGYRRVVGQSPQWREVLKQATQVAATETTALILGESGTGKEVVARFVHRGSARKAGPFVALNCAALPEQLLEAELFGYERGAFTGAVQSKPGQLEQAAGGTLFLDEVGEMSPQAQAKFLRVIQEREFQRLGGTRVLRADARIVAATNRDLLQAMQKGQFREDLYYRLNVFAIRLPPLRERRDDILPLAEAFVAEFGRTLGRPPAGVSRDARQALLAYRWPGNVRELHNVLERAAILCDGGLIVADHLALRDSVAGPAGGAAAPAGVGGTDLKATERALIERALRDAKFNKSHAARLLGLTRSQLYVRLRQHGLE